MTTVRGRDRPGHHVDPVHDLRPLGPRGRPSTRRSTSRSSRRPAGSSTTPNEIWTQHPRRSPAGALAKADLTTADIAAVGITNQRETARRVGQDHRASRSTTRSSGRTPAPTAIVPGTGRLWAAARSGTGTRPGCRWRPTSPAPRSAGSSTTSRARASAPRAGDLLFGNMDTWVLWNMTGGPTAACTSPTPPTRRARC